MENGEPLQIKLVLTASKTPVENDNNPVTIEKEDSAVVTADEQIPQEPSEEEKEHLKILLDKLGL